MATPERGTVKFFDSRAERRFGFILLESGEEVFFHLNDGAPVEAGSTEPVLQTNFRAREPQKGDALFFWRSANYKGTKAAPWCFANDWEKAEQEISLRIVYRLWKQTGGFRVRRDPVLIWEGYDLTELRIKFGYVKLGFHYEPGSSDWTDHWFESEWPGGWRRLDCDPREFKEARKVPIEKPSMPFEVAERQLVPARRNAVSRYSSRGIVVSTSFTFVDGGKKVAYGYRSHSVKSITMEETGEYARITFEGPKAEELLELGMLGKNVCIENDSLYGNSDIEFSMAGWYE